MDYEKLLNAPQLEAVRHFKGPLLILAGAGSGKTRALTYRIAYLIDVHKVDPWNILALTFTNKAAGEMKERVESILGCEAGGMWISTFHSACVRILRKYIDRIGYDNSFTIYDSADSKTLMKQILKNLNIDSKRYKETAFLTKISHAKDRLITPDQMASQAGYDYDMVLTSKVYREYQSQLKKCNSLDFDDLLFKTVELFRCCDEALEYYRRRFKYIMVDEYQDTNHAQFELIKLLASTTNEEGFTEHNLCVVGDDDQSIYRFRGADISNILDFEQTFMDAKIIRLEQNYRSTPQILSCANEVIKKNSARKGKTLWTDNAKGDPVSFTQFPDSNAEASGIANAIISGHNKIGEAYKNYAVLYRTNSQSRSFEEEFVRRGIPYRLIGGTNFYARKEIKDMLAYLRVINNPDDEVSLRRIINVPARGIGLTTISKLSDYSVESDITLYTALIHAKSIPSVSRAASKIAAFTDLIEGLRQKASLKESSVYELMNDILDLTGYTKELIDENTTEATTRLEYIDEFCNKIAVYEEEHDEDEISLSSFLEEVSLVADIDNYDENEDSVVLMTVHGSKGLEFPNVFLTGMEDGIFPGYRSINAENSEDEIAEERRLFYVGVTRAMNNLCLTCAKLRMMNGELQYNKPSRFIYEIPRHLLKVIGNAPKPAPVFKPESSQKKFDKISSISNGIFDKSKKNETSTPPYILPVLKAGDRVKHSRFGVGTVAAVTPLNNDPIVTVNFDSGDVKKMKASFAKLELL